MAKTILIVDDSASLRQVVGIALKGAGYDVIEGCDGKDALAKLTGQKVHLIISDVNMPNMDGITFVKNVKQLPAYKFTPVIMLTTESGEGKTGVPRPKGIPKALNTAAVWFALALGADPKPDAVVQKGLKRFGKTMQGDQTENGSWASWPNTRPSALRRSRSPMPATCGSWAATAATPAG